MKEVRVTTDGKKASKTKEKMSSDLCCGWSGRGWGASTAAASPQRSCRDTGKQSKVRTKVLYIDIKLVCTLIYTSNYTYVGIKTNRKNLRENKSSVGAVCVCVCGQLTRRRAAGTAGQRPCGPGAAAPARRSAGWRAPWRGSSGSPETPGSPCRCADTLQTAAGAPGPGPGTTPERGEKTKNKAEGLVKLSF